MVQHAAQTSSLLLINREYLVTESSQILSLFQFAFRGDPAHNLSIYNLTYNHGLQKTQKAMSNCSFALGPYISPMTIVLLTDLGLSIPLSFIDKCISMSVDSTIY